MRNNEERLGANMARQDALMPQTAPNQSSVDASAAPLSFIVPTEHVLLPSGGKFYPSHHPLHNKDTIEIKQMTAKEEDILTSKNLLKKGVALDKLIQSLVVDKQINTDTLTIEDRNAIVVAARISGYGEEYITQVSCPECETKVKHKFNLAEKLENPVTPLEVPVGEDGTFSLTLPVTNWNIKCRALNGYDERIILKLSEEKKNDKNGDSLLLQQLKMSVVEIQNVTDKNALVQALEAMPVKDSKYIRAMYERIVVPLNMTKTFSCDNCEYQTTLEVPLTADFFWFK